MGNFKFTIENKCPDFVDKKLKLIVEYDGVDYWHDEGKDAKRNKVYISNGWRILSIKSDPFKIDEANLINEVRRFIASNRKLVMLKLDVDKLKLIRVKE